MRGTCYGDFSRSRFDPARRYTGVLAQQGRVQLDADFNDQYAIEQHALRTVLRDLHAGSWAPVANPGFGLRPRAALGFNGTERLILDETGALAPKRDGEHTLELWLTWSGDACVLVDCRGQGGGLCYELAIEKAGTLVLTLAVQEGAASSLVLYATSPVPTGKPLHLAVVIGRDRAGLFVNGQQVAGGPHSGVDRADAPRVVFGGPFGKTAAAGFRGELTAIRIWRIARTVEQLANGTRPASASVRAEAEQGLLAVWTFDRPSASPLDDSTGRRTARVWGGGSPRWRLVDLEIEPGRLYVDGVVCEQTEAISYTSQPGRPAGALPAEGEYLAYLEAWEESVGAAEDPSLREIALGGLDTSLRTRIATRVRLHKLAAGDSERLSAPAQPRSGRLRAEHTGQIAPGNHLYRVEIHAGGRPGGEHPATFKWSRDNGASLFGVAGSGASLTLTYAPAGAAALAPDDVVEALPAGAPLDAPAHPLLSVVSVSAAAGTVTLTAAPPAGTALLRRWDNRPADSVTASTGAALVVGTGWTNLEDGIRISFEDGHFNRGDYWWIVSRMDLGSIEWPTQAGKPQALPPNGVERVTAPLARLSLAGGGIEIEDLRKLVGPIAVAPPKPAIWTEPLPDPDAEADAAELEQDAETDAAELEQDAETDAAELEQDAQTDAAELEREVEPGEEELGRALDGFEPLEFARLEALDDELQGGPDENVAAADEEAAAFEVITGEVVAPDGELVNIELSETDLADVGLAEGGRAELRSLDPTTAVWSAVVDLELPGDRLGPVVSAAGTVVLMTGRALYRVSVLAGRLEQIASEPAGRYGHRLIAVDSALFLVGGRSSDDRPGGCVFELSLETGRWTERSPAPGPATGAAHTVARGRLHVLGGETQALVRHRVSGAHHAYHPIEDRWVELPPMPTARAGAVAAAIGSAVYVAGGHRNGRDRVAQPAHESYDLDSQRWRAEPPLPVSRLVLCSAATHERHLVVLARGSSGEHSIAGQVASFHAPGSAWEALPDVPEPLRDPSLVVVGGRILLIGGLQDGRARVYELA